MRKFLLVTVLSVLVTSANGATLIKAELTPGFVANPQRKVFILDSTGMMTIKITELRTQKTVLQRLGQLSLYSVNQIRKEISTINAATPLIDQNEGGPLCIDIPAYTVQIFKFGKAKGIYRSANCHMYRLETFLGEKSIDLGIAFLNF